MTSDLRWHFPSSGGGEEDGVNDSGLEMFEGDHAYYLAREVIQNSIDARRAECKFVEVHFRVTHIDVKEIPGWENLKPVLKACLKEVQQEAGGGKEKSKGEVLYEEAIALTGKLPVLIASDFNTTGLCGDEDEKGGQWYKCIRKKGSNRPRGDGGGTFGIGKHAPFPASKLRSVFYSTINDKNQPAFTGKAILSSFEMEGDVKRGTGFFGDWDGRRAAGVRNAQSIPPFFRRKEQGLSLFVMGFRDEGTWKTSLMKAVLENFFAAIDREMLKVVFEFPEGAETIDSSSLEKLVAKYAPETQQFLSALRHPIGGKPIIGKVPHIGSVQLYLAHGKDYERKVVFMRRPLIKVEKKTRNLVHEPFAGVFICDDKDGNKVLGALEPPTHEKWDAKRDPVNGANVIIRLNEWLNAELRKLNSDTTNEREDVAELAEYLAEDSDLPGERPVDMSGSDQPVPESGRETGKEKERETILPIATKRRPTRIQPKDGGGRLIRKKSERPGRAGKRGGGEGSGGPRRVELRAGLRWIPESQESPKAVLVIRPEDDFSGTLRLVGVGEDGDVPVRIRRASVEQAGALTVIDGAIRGIGLKAGVPIRVKVELEEPAWEAVSLEAYDR